MWDSTWGRRPHPADIPYWPTFPVSQPSRTAYQPTIPRLPTALNSSLGTLDRARPVTASHFAIE